MAESFSEYFSSIADIFKAQSTTTPDFHKLKEFINERLPQDTQFNIPLISEDFVKAQLLHLKKNTATGIDNLSAKILTYAAPVIAPVVAQLINMSISSSTVPKRWKCARVTPLFKGGNATEMNCYRPISILPLLSKVLERHVFDQFHHYLATYDLLSQNQSGFRRHHSCQSMLIKITDYLLSNMDEGNIVGLAMIDLRKAFDLVDHATLLTKLHLYGLDTSAMSWFNSYLGGRQFQVRINNQLSSKADIVSGVPQGSILGPLLFILYMNDLPLHLNNTLIDLYADDATQYVAGSSLQDVEHELNNELQPISDWTNENKMTVNTTKTKAMVIGTTHKLRGDICLAIDGVPLETTTIEKLLGVQMDHHLTWSSHINTLCKKITQRLGILRRIRHFLPLKARKAFYNCLILSLMDYCCVVWGNTSQANLDRLLKLQKKAARLILDTDNKAHSSPLFLQLGWLPIHDRIKFFRCLLVYKSLNSLAPDYIADLLSPFHRVHDKHTRASTNNVLQLPRVRTNCGKRSFAFLAASDWNSLEPELRDAGTTSQFRNSYLRMAFSKLYNQ